MILFLIFAWIVGALFTFGLNVDPEDEDIALGLCMCLAAWPFFLGQWVRGFLKTLVGEEDMEGETIR